MPLHVCELFYHLSCLSLPVNSQAAIEQNITRLPESSQIAWWFLSEFLPSQRQRRVGGEVGWGEIAGLEAGPGGGGDHGGVVGGEGQGGEGNRYAARSAFGGEAGAEFAVGGDAAGDEDSVDGEGFGGGEGFLHEIADDGVLEAGDQVEGLLGAEGQGFGLCSGWFGWQGGCRFPGPRSEVSSLRTWGARISRRG